MHWYYAMNLKLLAKQHSASQVYLYEMLIQHYLYVSMKRIRIIIEEVVTNRIRGGSEHC